MINFSGYDITALYPESMHACSMHDAGAMWSYSEFDESMGLYFSHLNNCWLLDSAIYGDDRNDLFLIPAYVAFKDMPDQYVVATETVLRQTHKILLSGQSCVWESSACSPGYIEHVHAKDDTSEETVSVGELSFGNLSGEELQRAREVLETSELSCYLIGKMNDNHQVSLYMIRMNFADAD